MAFGDAIDLDHFGSRVCAHAENMKERHGEHLFDAICSTVRVDGTVRVVRALKLSQPVSLLAPEPEPGSRLMHCRSFLPLGTLLRSAAEPSAVGHLISCRHPVFAWPL